MTFIVQTIQPHRNLNLKYPVIETKAFDTHRGAHIYAIGQCVLQANSAFDIEDYVSPEQCPIDHEGNGWRRIAPDGYEYTPWNTDRTVWIRIEKIQHIYQEGE